MEYSFTYLNQFSEIWLKYIMVYCSKFKKIVFTLKYYSILCPFYPKYLKRVIIWWTVICSYYCLLTDGIFWTSSCSFYLKNSCNLTVERIACVYYVCYPIHKLRNVGTYNKNIWFQYQIQLCIIIFQVHKTLPWLIYFKIIMIFKIRT